MEAFYQGWDVVRGRNRNVYSLPPKFHVIRDAAEPESKMLQMFSIMFHKGWKRGEIGARISLKWASKRSRSGSKGVAHRRGVCQRSTTSRDSAACQPEALETLASRFYKSSRRGEIEAPISLKGRREEMPHWHAMDQHCPSSWRALKLFHDQ